MMVWTDVETTGLDERRGHLLEVALVVTSDDLVELDCARCLVKPVVCESWDEFVAGLDPVVREMHTKSGLLDEVGRLGPGNSASRVEVELLGWLHRLPEKWTTLSLWETPLCGSTVGFDRRWLRAHMPDLEAAFYYRSVDVSGLVELSSRWAPGVWARRPKKKEAHRALDDAREAIDYLRYFRDCGFVATDRGARLMGGTL